MIAQLQQSLIQRNTNYEKKKNLDDVASVLTERSLKDRLASLSNSAEQWKSRPTRETPPPLQQQRRTSANILQDLPIFQRNQSINQQRQSLPVSTVIEKPCDITSGLKKFFNSNNPTSSSKIDGSEGIEIDLDVISAKATPVLKTVTRPRAPNRKRAVKSENLHDDRLHLSTVKLTAPPIDDDQEPEKLETQEQAIAALKDAKCLLKTPTKVSPYPQVMLIQIRGSKYVDVRLVAPAMTSLHESACFLVVSQENLLKYEGSASNILEKTKAAQLAIQIMGKADLNCHASTLTTVTRSSQSGRSQLSKLLYSSENQSSNHAPLNTDPFETQISKLNLVLRIADNDRTAHVCSRRERVSYSILKPSEVLIFDFGSEIYVWSGRYSSKVSTAYAVEYAKQLMEKAVLKNGRSLLGETEESERDGRPEWTLFRKIHQGVLDTLFQSKFSDWPETRELVNTCKPKPLFSNSKKLTNPDVKTYEDVKISNEDDDVMRLAERMLSEPEFDPILILEDQEIDRNLRDVISESRDLWILQGETLENIDFSEHFDSAHCYVFRWKYRIQKSGVRRLKTGETTERETGRTRIAFFYWLGEHTTPKQHGLCALRIKEIDRDNSPRVRVADGNEPALFLALFDGKFRVSRGKAARRYVAIGANLRETSLREIDDLDAPLRSHSAYIDFLATTATQTATPHIICGANCTPAQVHFVLAHASHLGGSAPQVEVEGDRKSRRWIQSNGRKRAARMWRIFENEAEPVHHLSAHSECAFNFSQQILSETILIDVGEALWLWSEDIVTTFSLKLVEKYWKSRQGPTRVVYKGAEPEQFKALFMKWTDSDEVENPMECRDAKELLKERCRTFSLIELKERTNLPAGMDMRRLESYLTDDDFQKAFGIGRDEFYAQKAWKQNEARKRTGLF
ncbi:hypothetical protein GCK72_002972 [Caenorhabditis remanei]|uniref:HP domain-containing protein n=1 Tax=Caenorhabditis remanei TaxID=31234 RepID=A0A6A5HWA5_CAERE|nr:hypothetical protein GCK72_002972 [Caenorhabditis remanei]KAF1771146.1 hypothetical protein GCK72_002972 [Caenorhabditis remanei]